MKKYKKIALSAIAALIICYCLFVGWKERGKEQAYFWIQVVDVGQGNCTVITTPEQKHVVIDAGPDSAENELKAYLKNQGIREIEYLFLTHLHDDHIGGADMLLSDFCVKNVVAMNSEDASLVIRKYYDALDLCQAQHKTILYKPTVDKIFAIGDLMISLLFVPQGDAADNNASLVLRLDYGNTSCLIAGDAEQKEETAILNTVLAEQLDVDLYVVSHHGASNASGDALLSAMSPEIAAISVGQGNSFGHPHEEVLERLQSAGATVYRTDSLGTLRFYSDGEQLYFDTSR